MSIYEDSVCNKLQQRAAIGLSKYGVSVERTDISVMGWANHLQEELMDAAVYIERFMACEEPTSVDVIELIDLMTLKTKAILFSVDEHDSIVTKLNFLLGQFTGTTISSIDEDSSDSLVP